MHDSCVHLIICPDLDTGCLINTKSGHHQQSYRHMVQILCVKCRCVVNREHPFIPHYAFSGAERVTWNKLHSSSNGSSCFGSSLKLVFTLFLLPSMKTGKMGKFLFDCILCNISGGPGKRRRTTLILEKTQRKDFRFVGALLTWFLTGLRCG